MTEIVNTTHTVRKGECAWSYAQSNLKAQGKKVNNNAIVKEMNRLAKLNGCSSVDDFNSKFFSKIGTTFKESENNVADKKQIVQVRKDSTLKDSIAQVPDATKVNKAPVVKAANKVAKKDSVKTDTVPVKKVVVKPEDKFKVESAKINSIKGDKNRIIEYNKLHGKGNYVIVDKKTCKATVYDKNGKALKSYEVLLGATKGDNLSTAYAKDKKLASDGRTTVPGEYKLSSRIGTFGGLRATGDSMETMDPDIEYREWEPGFYGKKKFKGGSQAIHGTADRNHRDKLYNNGNLADNRQSMGCINIPIEHLNEMEAKYGIKANSKLYILPEQKGNELVLTKRKDGEVKFITRYKDQKQNAKVAKIQNKIADKKIQRNLQIQRNKAALAAKEAKAKEIHLFEPSTWVNLFS